MSENAIYAVKVRGGWSIAEKVDGSAYGPLDTGRTVWSEVGTTTWVCEVGEEERIVQLEPEKP